MIPSVGGAQRSRESERAESKKTDKPGGKSRKPTGKQRRRDREIKGTESQIEKQRQRQSLEKRLTDSPRGGEEETETGAETG